MNSTEIFNMFFSKNALLSEECGIVTQNNKIIKVENKHKDPDNHFAFGKSKWENLHKKYKIKGTIHNHTYWHFSKPSKEDINYAKKYNHESIVVCLKTPSIIHYNGTGIIKKEKIKLSKEQKEIIEQLEKVIHDLENEKKEKDKRQQRLEKNYTKK